MKQVQVCARNIKCTSFSCYSFTSVCGRHVISIGEHLPLVDKLSLEVGMVGIGLGMVGKSRLDVSRLHWVHNNNKTQQLRQVHR